MPAATYRSHAVVVLPGGVSVRDAPPAERRWLAKGSVRESGAGAEPLMQVLHALGRPASCEGLAALRRWGQTGARPTGWICAADPVYLEARLDHLCLFALTDLAEWELAGLIEHLQARLAVGRKYRFSRTGACGYLESDEPMATAAVSAETAHGGSPDRFLPEGRVAAAHDRLQSELQMCLHDVELNRRREESGRPPVNALWLWGGGTVPARADQALPDLFADDPLFAGYWMSAGGQCTAWPGAFEDCVAAAGGAFVAVPPAEARDGATLGSLRGLLARGDTGRLTLLFRDGSRADLKRSDRFRFWRRESRIAATGNP